MFDRSTKNDETDVNSSRSGVDPVPRGDEQSSNVGRTGYDTLVGLGRWIRGIARKALLLLVVIGAWWFVGWYAAASIVVGIVIWYLVLNRLLNDQGAVYLDDVRDGVWTTWSIGQDAWADLKLRGVPFAFRSSDGRPRYMAESFDPDAGVVKFAWIHQLSSWKFFMSFRAHRSLLEILEKVLPENIKLRLYPRILGYREAAGAMQPIGQILDKDMLDANVDSDLWIKERQSIDSFFNLGIDEILDGAEEPDEKVKEGGA